jgi:hypothetical protein
MDGTFMHVDAEAEPGTVGLINTNVVYPRIWQTGVGRPRPTDDQPPTWVLQPWLPGVARLTLPTSSTTDLIASIGFEAAGQQPSTTARSIQRKVFWADQSHKKRIIFKPEDKRTATIYMDGEGLWADGPNEAKWRAAGKELQALIDAEVVREEAVQALATAEESAKQNLSKEGKSDSDIAAELPEDEGVKRARQGLTAPNAAVEKATSDLDNFLLTFHDGTSDENTPIDKNANPAGAETARHNPSAPAQAEVLSATSAASAASAQDGATSATQSGSAQAGSGSGEALRAGEDKGSVSHRHAKISRQAAAPELNGTFDVSMTKEEKEEYALWKQSQGLGTKAIPSRPVVVG